MVYELMVEGGITRYLALFLDQTTERIGSIRSARHYYLDYALENDAIYVHHGYSPQAREDWSKLGVDRIEVNESTTGWRDKSASKTYEFTLFTNIEKLGKGIKSKRTERNKDLLLNYSVDNIDISQMEGAIPANKVDIKYSSNTTTNYEYDTEKIKIFHFDVYRLTDVDEFFAIGGEEYFEKGASIIEWGEMIEDYIPQRYLKLEFSRDNVNENQRLINIENIGNINIKI